MLLRRGCEPQVYSVVAKRGILLGLEIRAKQLAKSRSSWVMAGVMSCKYWRFFGGCPSISYKSTNGWTLAGDRVPTAARPCISSTSQSQLENLMDLPAQSCICFTFLRKFFLFFFLELQDGAVIFSVIK